MQNKDTARSSTTFQQQPTTTTMDLSYQSRTTFSRIRGERGHVICLLVLLNIILMTLFSSPASAADSSYCGSGCMNGGKMMMPNNIFGYCRCKCNGPYVGPKCQFLTKRGVITGLGLKGAVPYYRRVLDQQPWKRGIPEAEEGGDPEAALQTLWNNMVANRMEFIRQQEGQDSILDPRDLDPDQGDPRLMGQLLNREITSVDDDRD